MKKPLVSFADFIREQGVVGLAIGFILGGSVNAVVKSLVADVIEPFLSFCFGSTEGLAEWSIGPVMMGRFLVTVVDFVILAAIVFFVFKGLGIEKLDKKKEK